MGHIEAPPTQLTSSVYVELRTYLQTNTSHMKFQHLQLKSCGFDILHAKADGVCHLLLKLHVARLALLGYL